ncbi:hypothetical protein BP5796_12584 [Coleophoma crateriformis]|uniref:Uncharacterized protein n=1 Tax=Coleophoma crateriformis TaxID=565419 RepID=A0A3D8Q7I6_9HELO|nr:hypothetical protein BP5796_12584 [Coleophoma crateriformis]
MEVSNKTDIVVDYLVVGAGASGLSFVDELLTRTSASILIVDKRDRPGGHWVDSYPYVRLHQPANQYGVESKELSNGRIDERGLNKGLSDLASGVEIEAYFHTLMRDTFLPSGRVTFLPSTEFLPDGTLRRGPSGQILTVQIKKRLVDASYYTNVIPLNHMRPFAVENVTCTPPNHLPNVAKDFTNFTVLGAGKTAMDTCLWLLEQDVDPARIRWIIPADYWFFNRANIQGSLEFFEESIDGFAGMFESISEARNASDFTLGCERAGVWMRLDPTIEPKQFHAATLAPREVEELRRIQDIVRKGHVTKIEAHQITLTHGIVEAKPDSLYIDCTASCLPNKPSVPVFQPGKIVLQMVRYPLIPFSCAKIAFLESLAMQDEERNTFTTPIRFTKNIDGFIPAFGINLENTAREKQHPLLQNWLWQSRLDTFNRLEAAIKPEDTEKLAQLGRLQTSFMAAYSNMPKLMSSLESSATY